MSSSVPCNIPYVLSLAAKNIFLKLDAGKIDIKSVLEGKAISLPGFSVLDVGCGFGKWGFLMHDSFDVMFGQNFNKKDWKINITGVEPFDKCITSIQKELYHEIIKKDIFEALPKLGKFDLIIIGDVIEHFEKEKAYELLNKLFEHSENIIISTPLGFIPQGPWAGNEREVHKSGWELADFKRFKVVEHKIMQDEMMAYIYSQIPGMPAEAKSGLKLIVLWLRK